MSAQPIEVLLVEPDDELAEMIARHAEESLGARVVHVTTAGQAIASYSARPPDVVVAEMELADRGGLALTRELRADPCEDAAVLLLSDSPTTGRMIEAMRLGVRDVFTKPFDLRRLSCVIEQEAREQRRRRGLIRENHRLRRLIKRMVRERRDLRQRVDLICRDIVSAYQTLARKVAETHAKCSD